jgi:hypothetical protein
MPPAKTIVTIAAISLLVVLAKEHVTANGGIRPKIGN